MVANKIEEAKSKIETAEANIKRLTDERYAIYLSIKDFGTIDQVALDHGLFKMHNLEKLIKSSEKSVRTLKVNIEKEEQKQKFKR